MIDYLLKFKSKQVAEQFGLANGFVHENEDGEIISSLASHTHALCEIGEHNGSDYWILFRDLIGIPIPAGADQFIYWSSEWTTGPDENGDLHPVPRPVDETLSPTTFWS